MTAARFAPDKESSTIRDGDWEANEDMTGCVNRQAGIRSYCQHCGLPAQKICKMIGQRVQKAMIPEQRRFPEKFSGRL